MAGNHVNLSSVRLKGLMCGGGGMAVSVCCSAETKAVRHRKAGAEYGRLLAFELGSLIFCCADNARMTRHEGKGRVGDAAWGAWDG